MRKKDVLAYAGRTTRSQKDTLIVDKVDIGGSEHLIIDLYIARELVLRVAVSDTDYAGYDYSNNTWKKVRSSYKFPYTLKRDIERMEKEQISVIDSVTGGNGGIQHYKIEGYPYPEYSRKRTLLMTRDNQLQVYEIKLLEITNEVERFIEKIENSAIRRMISYRFLDNMTWFQVAQRMGKRYTADGCRMTINRFLENK